MALEGHTKLLLGVVSSDLVPQKEQTEQKILESLRLDSVRHLKRALT